MNVNVSEQKPLEWNWYCLYYVRNLEFTFEPLNIYCHLDCTPKIKDPIHLTLSTQVQKLCSNQSKCIFIILNSSSLKHVTLFILFMEHSITIVQTTFIHISGFIEEEFISKYYYFMLVFSPFLDLIHTVLSLFEQTIKHYYNKHKKKTRET